MMDNYHSDFSSVSNTMLGHFRKSRRLFAELYVQETRKPAEPTSTQVVGSAVHCLLLEPAQFESRFIVAPNVDRRTNAGKAEWSEFLAKSLGKQVIKPDELSKARAMVESAHNAPCAEDLLSAQGICETAIRWKHRSGVAMRAKPDKVIVGRPASDGSRYNQLVEVKTSRVWRLLDFRREFERLLYYCQVALYLEGAKATYGTDPWFPQIIVIHNDEPYEVVVYDVGNRYLIPGTTHNDSDLKELAECYRSNDWRDDEEKGVYTLEPSRWAFTDADYEEMSDDD